MRDRAAHSQHSILGDEVHNGRRAETGGGGGSRQRQSASEVHVSVMHASLDMFRPDPHPVDGAGLLAESESVEAEGADSDSRRRGYAQLADGERRFRRRPHQALLKTPARARLLRSHRVLRRHATAPGSPGHPSPWREIGGFDDDLPRSELGEGGGLKGGAEGGGGGEDN